MWRPERNWRLSGRARTLFSTGCHPQLPVVGRDGLHRSAIGYGGRESHHESRLRTGRGLVSGRWSRLCDTQTLCLLAHVARLRGVGAGTAGRSTGRCRTRGHVLVGGNGCRTAETGGICRSRSDRLAGLSSGLLAKQSLTRGPAAVASADCGPRPSKPMLRRVVQSWRTGATILTAKVRSRHP